jgi:hypothetical protein
MPSPTRRLRQVATGSAQQGPSGVVCQTPFTHVAWALVWIGTQSPASQSVAVQAFE